MPLAACRLVYMAPLLCHLWQHDHLTLSAMLITANHGIKNVECYTRSQQASMTNAQCTLSTASMSVSSSECMLYLEHTQAALQNNTSTCVIFLRCGLPSAP